MKSNGTQSSSRNHAVFPGAVSVPALRDAAAGARAERRRPATPNQIQRAGARQRTAAPARCSRRTVGTHAPAAPVAPAAPAIAATVSEASAREIVVETTKVKAVFSNRGATIVHWILKEYRTDEGEPLDLVPQGAGADAIKPFTLTVDDPGDRARASTTRSIASPSTATPPGEMVDATASPQTIVFETASADGFSVKKTFAVEPTSYVIDVRRRRADGRASGSTR